MTGLFPDMKITAIVPWYGSKRTMAPQIIDLLGDHDSYFEPFCGSMAVLLGKMPAKQETVCDLHGDLTNLAWVLQDHAKAVQLYDRLMRTLFCEDVFLQARESLKGDQANRDPVDWAWAFFVVSWGGRNGVCGMARMSFAMAVRWTATGGSATTRFRSAVESVPAWHDRLRNAVILRRSAWDVLPKIPDEANAAIYCDPPYIIESRGGGDADGGYRHDFDNTDHRKLADELNRFHAARVVVSYYAHPALEVLYPPARWEHIDATMTKNLATQNKRGSTRGIAPEVLIVNRREVTA